MVTKIAAIGDVHLRDTTPRSRVDDFYHTQKDKVFQVLKNVISVGCRTLLVPGDLFHHVTVSDRLKAEYIRLFKDSDIHILVIPGQHDMRYHQRQLKNTPMMVFNAAKAVTIVFNPMVIGRLHDIDVGLYPAWWGQWNGDLEKLNRQVTHGDLSMNRIPDVNILLIHKMIVQGDEPLRRSRRRDHGQSVQW